MNWFLGSAIVKFPGIDLEQSIGIVNSLKTGIGKNELKLSFEALDIKKSSEVIQGLVREGFLADENIKISESSKGKHVPLSDIFLSGEAFYSGFVIAHHWCWYFPIRVDMSTVKDILRKELGQLCFTEDDQLFRTISCNGGRHLFPERETRIDVAEYSSLDPIRIDLSRKTIHHIWDVGKTLSSMYIGPGKVIESVVKSDLELPFSMYFARYSDPDEYNAKPHPDCWACGRDEKGDMAKLKAIAESVERYAASQIPINAILGTFNEIEVAVHPSELIQVSSNRLNKIDWLENFDESHKYLWVDGYEYFSGKGVKILSDLVYYPYYPDYKSVAVSSSTGVATHQSFDLAVESAALELMERDAFIIHWLLKKSPDLIEKSSLPVELNGYLNWIEANLSSFCLFNLGIDSVPIFGGMAIKENAGLWVSAAADCDPKKAITKVLQELIASVATRGNPVDSAMPSKIRRVADHEILYRFKEAQKQAMFLSEGNERAWTEIIGGYKKHESIIDFLGELSQPLYVVKLQCYSQARCNIERLFTVRTLSPYFVPFYFAEELISDASCHLKEIQKAWGRYDLNSYPHPFA